MARPEDDELDQAVTSPADAAGRRSPSSARSGDALRTPVDAAVLTALAQRYDAIEELGRGGMGIVFRARDKETGGDVALKVLQPDIAANPELMVRFKSELLLARKVTHKNVCRVHELIRLGSVAAISMEYVEGESLRAMLKREQGFSIRYALNVTRQMLAGLREAHAQGVVHRDLKPENILISRDGTVKVMDFGIALSLNAGTTHAGGFLGTPAYMSPEQAQSKPADARSDIYSLGLVLYEIFTGAPAFTADTTTTMLMKHVKEMPATPRSLEPNLPDYLERVILKCLAKDPAKRFQSVAELETALEEQRPAEAILEEEPVPAPHHSVWGVADSVLLVLGAAGLFIFFLLRNDVFPAHRFRLEMDSIAARREAEAVAKRLGRTFPPQWKAELEYRAPDYVAQLISRFALEGKKRKPAEIYRSIEPPLFWKVSFRSLQDDIVYSAEAAPERFVRLDRRGKVIEFLHPISRASLARNYRAPPVEQRRTIAAKALADVCGVAAPAAAPVETAGEEGGASYTARWGRTEVSLFAENVTSVKCDPMPETAMMDGSQLADVQGLGGNFLRAIGLVSAFAFLVVMTLAAFVRAQCFNSPVLWKRLPLAALAGLPSAWVLFPWAFGTSSWTALLLGGIGATGLLLVGIVAIEHHLTRRMPAEVAAYRLALRARFREPAVGASVLRGALAGLVLIGLQTALARISLNFPPLSFVGAAKPVFSGFFPFFFASYVDPATVGYGMASQWPAAYVTFSAIFHGLLVGLVFVGLGWLDGKRYVRNAQSMNRAWRTMVVPVFCLLNGLNLALVALGLRLHFAAVFGFGFSLLVVPGLFGTLLAWVFWRYGALAAIVATATQVLWTLNYPMLFMLREVGNTTQWAVFAGWALFVAGATFAAFRSKIMEGASPLGDWSE